MKRDTLRHTSVSFVCAVLCLGACATASAQWLPDRNYTEGPGIKLGERFELHPGIAVRAGYDSNVYRYSSPRLSSGMLAITPHLNISSTGAQRRKDGEAGGGNQQPKLKLESGASLSYVYYFDDVPPRGVEVDVGSSLQLFPGRVVNGTVDLQYQRNIRPFTQASSNQNFNQNQILAGASLGFQSHGGTLQATVGFKPNTTIFEKATLSVDDFRYLNNVAYQIPMNMVWKFFPHTALLWDASLRRQHFLDSPYLEGTSASGVLLADSIAYESRLGVRGALTNHISMQALAGFASGFYSDDRVPNADALDEYLKPIASAKLTYNFGSQNSVSAGYERGVGSSYVGAWQLYDRGKIEGRMLLARAFSLRASFDVGKYTYGAALAQNGDPLGVGGDAAREDIRYNAGVNTEYRVTNYLAFMADFTAQVVDTDFEYVASPPGSPVVPQPADYVDFQIFGGVRAFY